MEGASATSLLMIFEAHCPVCVLSKDYLGRSGQEKIEPFALFTDMRTVLSLSSRVRDPPGAPSVAGGHWRAPIPGKTLRLDRDRGIIRG
jgi:hypothetical protein